MTQFNPLRTPVDVVQIARRGQPVQTTPGLARIYDANQKLAWDQQQGYGASGAVVIYRGTKLVEFSLELRFWLPEHWDAWDTFRPLVQRPPFGKRPTPLTISHPWLAQQEISQVVVTQLDQPVIDEYMLGTVKIGFLEYRVPRIALAKPQGDPAQPLDPYDQEIARNRATIEQQNQELAK